jgi:hypothetical protein
MHSERSEESRPEDRPFARLREHQCILNAVKNLNLKTDRKCILNAVKNLDLKTDRRCILSAAKNLTLTGPSQGSGNSGRTDPSQDSGK